MSRHERFMARLAEIAREYEEKLRPEEWVKSRLRWEDWETLRRETVVFAKGQMRRRKWRGSRSGVLPEGYDAEAIANEAIEEMLEGKCRIGMGFTRERVVAELQRLVTQRVRLLHRLKEAKAVRGEWDRVDDEGRRVSLLDSVSDDGEDTIDAVVRREEEERRKRVTREFDLFLKREPELRAVFGCLREGVTESRGMAERLGVDVSEVVKRRKKLERRVGEFGRKKNGEGI